MTEVSNVAEGQPQEIKMVRYEPNYAAMTSVKAVVAFLKEMNVQLVVPEGHFDTTKHNPDNWVEVDATTPAV